MQTDYYKELSELLTHLHLEAGNLQHAIKVTQIQGFPSQQEEITERLGVILALLHILQSKEYIHRDEVNKTYRNFYNHLRATSNGISLE